jgi:hypothetical protein
VANNDVFQVRTILIFLIGTILVISAKIFEQKHSNFRSLMPMMSVFSSFRQLIVKRVHLRVTLSEKCPIQN